MDEFLQFGDVGPGLVSFARIGPERDKGLKCADGIHRSIQRSVSQGQIPVSPGQIRFQADSSGAIAYGSLTVSVQIYTVVLTSTPGTLWCNTYDLDGTGTVTPIDLGNFAGKYNTVSEDCDYDWGGGVVNPIDLGKFAQHYGH